MNMIHAGQIKAARAILDWTRDDLAHATGLSSNTIRNLELGIISPRGRTTFIIRQAIEEAGLEFTEDEGIRRRKRDINYIQGIDSREALFEDIVQTLKMKGGDLGGIFPTLDLMTTALGVTDNNDVERLEELNELTSVKCLFASMIEPPVFLSRFEFRTIPKHCVTPVPYFVYANKSVFVVPESIGTFQFLIFKALPIVQNYKNHFATLWTTATPVLTTDKQRIRA